MRVSGGAGGVLVLAGGALLGVALIAFGVASTLGMGAGSVGNDGIGSPLTTEEVRALTNTKREGGDGTVYSYEEAAEEQALVDVLQGGIIRAR